jgi:hypothetical protein
MVIKSGIESSEVLQKRGKDYAITFRTAQGSVQQESDGRGRDQVHDTYNAHESTFDLFFPALKNPKTTAFPETDENLQTPS